MRDDVAMGALKRSRFGRDQLEAAGIDVTIVADPSSPLLKNL